MLNSMEALCVRTALLENSPVLVLLRAANVKQAFTHRSQACRRVSSAVLATTHWPKVPIAASVLQVPFQPMVPVLALPVHQEPLAWRTVLRHVDNAQQELLLRSVGFRCALLAQLVSSPLEAQTHVLHAIPALTQPPSPRPHVRSAQRGFTRIPPIPANVSHVHLDILWPQLALQVPLCVSCAR